MSHQRRRARTARIWKSVVRTDRRGNTVASPDTLDGPYEVKVWAIPQRSSRAEVPGQQQINVIRIGVDPNLPDVDLWSRVELDGHLWDMVTPPTLHYGVRRHTRHWSIDLRERP